jgi:DNA damage-binding protein 1
VYDFELGSWNKIATYRTSTAPIDIVVTDDTIAIADIMKSVSIVQFKVGEVGEPSTLEEVARHYQVAWSTAIANVDKDTYLESDAEGNLMVMKQNFKGVTLEDRKRLEIISEMQLGELVNRIRRIDVPKSENALTEPRAFLATVSLTFAVKIRGKVLTALRLKAPSISLR